RNQKRKHDEI
nr:Chain B, Histone acetyltransferase KAT8 [Homo sapiens]